MTLNCGSRPSFSFMSKIHPNNPPPPPPPPPPSFFFPSPSNFAMIMDCFLRHFTACQLAGHLVDSSGVWTPMLATTTQNPALPVNRSSSLWMVIPLVARPRYPFDGATPHSGQATHAPFGTGTTTLPDCGLGPNSTSPSGFLTTQICD